MKPYFSPFLIIGWIAVIIQIIFAANHNQTGNLICMGIALPCFIISGIQSTLHYRNQRKKVLDEITNLMDEIENKNKGKL